MTGKLIIFEGPDGVGKTTIALEVADALRHKDLNVKFYSFPGKHSFGTLGYHIYDLHHNKEKFGIEEMCPESLQILHIAAHVDLFKRYIIPNLENGNVVILDRFWWSTMVYGRVAGISQNLLEDICYPEESMMDSNKISKNPIIFLINGKYRRDNPPNNFDELVKAYDRKFKVGSVTNLCHQMNNDRGLQHVVNHILDILGEFYMKKELLEQWTN